MGSEAKQLIARNGISLAAAGNTTSDDARRVRLTPGASDYGPNPFCYQFAAAGAISAP